MPPAPVTETRLRPVVAAAIVWSVAFAAIHVAWALGSSAGLGGRSVTGALLVIDVLAIPLCLLAAWVAWRLGSERRAATAPKVVRTMALVACGVLTLRGLGTVQALLWPPDDATLLTRLVDPYFLVGGMLFGFVARLPRAAGPSE